MYWIPIIELFSSFMQVIQTKRSAQVLDLSRKKLLKSLEKNRYLAKSKVLISPQETTWYVIMHDIWNNKWMYQIILRLLSPQQNEVSTLTVPLKKPELMAFEKTELFSKLSNLCICRTRNEDSSREIKTRFDLVLKCTLNLFNSLPDGEGLKQW